MNDESLWAYILSFFQTYGPSLPTAIWTTLWIVGASLIVGLFIAVPCGMILASRTTWIIRYPVALFSYIFRGTPMLIQLYTIYFALGLWISEWPSLQEFTHLLLRNKAFWAICCFALNTGAYTSEIVRGALETAPKGEIEAAKAYGFTKWQIYRRILFPGAIRRALPAYANEVIFMLHGSAILSTIAIMDITQAVRIAYGKTYEPYLPFITAAILYLLITMIIFYCFKLIEKRLFKHLAPIQTH